MLECNRVITSQRVVALTAYQFEFLEYINYHSEFLAKHMPMAGCGFRPGLNYEKCVSTPNFLYFWPKLSNSQVVNVAR